MGVNDNPRIGKSFGNEDVVRLFEHWLAQARKGQINYAAVAATEPGAKITFDYGGSIELEQYVPQVLGMLKEEVEDSVASRQPPPVNPMLGADHVCYNAAAYPLSFDVLPRLVNAEMTRRLVGAPAPLKVAFWRGIGGHLGLQTKYRQQMFTGVVRPLLSLFGAVEANEAFNGRPCDASYGDLVDRARAGEQVPKITVPAAAAKLVAGFEEPITITLREAEHWPHRNSNLEAWTRFASDLVKRGRQVIFIRDTAEAAVPLKGFMIFPQASRDLEIRMALYERAAYNFFVSNGPGTLAFFGNRPIRQFIPIAESSEFFPETAEWWKLHGHMNVGEQYPWARPDQRLVWTTDSYENICQAWETQT